MISIHSTREGGDRRRKFYWLLSQRFQSTPPAKAETDVMDWLAGDWKISIHSTREGGDYSASRAAMLEA